MISDLREIAVTYILELAIFVAPKRIEVILLKAIHGAYKEIIELEPTQRKGEL